MNKRTQTFNSKQIALLSLYFAMTASGVTQCLTQHTGAFFLFRLLQASMATFWVTFDSRIRGQPLVNIAQFIIFISWPIAVPIYLIWTRGVRGLGWAVLNIVGLLFALYLGFYLTVWLVFGPDAFLNPPAS